jgi:hypothetical protein
MQDAGFFPYNPRAMRAVILLSLVMCALLAALALADARRGGEVHAWARVGGAVGLGAAFAYVFLRVRPRDGWGVRVTPLLLTVSRPLSGPPLEVPWDRVREVRRDGRKRERLLVLLEPEGRVLLARHLFASRAQFEALSAALQARAPAGPHDA